jgi:hypothetical protein
MTVRSFHRVIPAKTGISVCDFSAPNKAEIPAFAVTTLWLMMASQIRGEQAA